MERGRAKQNTNQQKAPSFAAHQRARGCALALVARARSPMALVPKAPPDDPEMSTPQGVAASPEATEGAGQPVSQQSGSAGQPVSQPPLFGSRVGAVPGALAALYDHETVFSDDDRTSLSGTMSPCSSRWSADSPLEEASATGNLEDVVRANSAMSRARSFFGLRMKWKEVPEALAAMHGHEAVLRELLRNDCMLFDSLGRGIGGLITYPVNTFPHSVDGDFDFGVGRVGCASVESRLADPLHLAR